MLDASDYTLSTFTDVTFEDYSDPDYELYAEPLIQKLVDALSPSGILYDLWPTIIELATDQQREKCLSKVNTHFASVYRRILTDVAQYYYFNEDNAKLWERIPLSKRLDLPREGVDWASWGAARFYFGNIKRFRKFCALGGVDPVAGAFQFDRWRYLSSPYHEADMCWVFVSRTRDLFFETGRQNPVLQNEKGTELYCRFFGITGRADKVKQMYQFVIESKRIDWDYLEWGNRNEI